MGNFITSDALFTALSLVWFTQLLWLIYKPGRLLLVVHSLVLLAAFTVRYNALYYPFISVLAILLLHIRARSKILAIGLLAFLLLAFIGATQQEYQKQTGIIQFSAFGGWQLAINALYGYAHEPLDSIDKVPLQFRHLQTLVNKHMDSLNHLSIRPDSFQAIYYLSNPSSPLNVYLRGDTSNPTIKGYTNRWLSMGPFYGRYGSYLIKKHRAAYVHYYLIPNFLHYLAPAPEFMGRYGVSSRYIDPVAMSWFQLANNENDTYTEDRRINLIQYLPIFFGMANIIFILSLSGFAGSGGFTSIHAYVKRMIWFVLLVWLCNMLFSILASGIALRYQVFPFIMLYTFGTLLINFIWTQSRSTEIAKTVQNDASKQSVIHHI